MEYTIVTQIYLCLTAEQCNVTSVCDLVAEQVGFPVIRKCYPLSANAGTCGVDFWKTSRKILAASKSLYVQLSGSETKKPRQETLVLEKIAALEKKVSVPVEMSKAMQCSICQGIASPPVVSSCCQRIVAFADCNHTWRRENERCPLCNTSPQASTHTFELRGFDDVARLLGACPAGGKPSHSVVDTPDDGNSEDEFESLPTFTTS